MSLNKYDTVTHEHLQTLCMVSSKTAFYLSMLIVHIHAKFKPKNASILGSIVNIALKYCFIILKHCCSRSSI
uniref:Uncharacterized protein n=1 Tax=Anguilla anguilla TaxID=7936 RepID=A0A0E9X844_ANGAN